jgi:predicted kinase|nr:MAG TPA: putative kinase [Caudoviricetes sp.]
MRTLLLLRGAPGAGKSTWIEENNLQNYTLEADKFRQLTSNPVLGLNGDLHITQDNDRLAWDLLFQALESRMQRGDFTIVDATHSNEAMFNKYRGLIEKYRYKIYYKTFDVDLEELERRNLTRPEHKRVPLDAVRRVKALVDNTKPTSSATEINDISEIINYWTDDLTNKYENVKIIGDLQGCYSVLKEAIGSELNPNTKYVFAGDILDRGIENKEVLDFMLSIYTKPNVVFVEGNHDTHLRNWAMDTWPLKKSGEPNIPREFNFKTLPQLLDQKKKSEFTIGTHEVDDAIYYTVNDKLTTIPVWTSYDESIVTEPHLKYKDGTLWLKPYKTSRTEIDTGIPVNRIDSEQLKSKVRQFVRRFRLAYAFEFHDQKYFVNHGGISALPNMVTISGEQLIKGVGAYEYQIDEAWEQSYLANKTQGFIQVHGHRHTESTEHSICLEDDVEYGGNLVILEISKDGHEVKKFKNKVFKVPTEDDFERERKAWIEDTQNPITNKMIHDKYIKVKDLDDNLMSLNFSEKAFYKKKWTENTITARGLFVDKTSGDIKIRSYNKFFNLNENAETSVRELKKKVAYPLMAYEKYNGFLGIASSVNSVFTLASKSTTSGPFVEYFQEIFNDLTDSEKEQLKQLSEKYHCSFTFEVMHIDDRHIIDFSQNRLVILDAIPNSYNINGITVDATFSENVLSQLNIESDFFSRKELVKEFTSMEDLMRYINEHKHDRTSEGLVIEDQNGYMFKVKYEYYTELKRLRGLRDVVKAYYHTKNVTQYAKNATQVAFAAWCKQQPFEKLKECHIIDLFKEYEEQLGTKVL